jgi:tripartite-type tricarboxylate transporter receptor subunit TctC
MSLGVLATGLMPGAARAQAYPGGQTIRVIVGFPAGGGQDTMGRLVADRLTAYWRGASVVVENVPGAGSNLAFDRIAKGPADGTQILIVPPGLATNQFLYTRVPFDPEKDFTPLGLVATFANLLCVRNDLPVNSVAELIAYAKANPGKLNFGAQGIGTTPHLAGEMLKSMTGITFATVQHRGSAPTINSILSGAIDFMMDNTTSITPHIRAGRLRALGVTSLKRLALAPEFVPIADTLPGYEVLAFTGIAVRSGTPKPICDSIEAAVQAACQDPVLKGRLDTMLADVGGTGAQAFADFLAAERAKWGKLITQLGLKVGN